MSLLTRALGLAAGMALLALPALAAPPWSGTYDELPGGSYQRSCRDLTAFNGRLYARCQTSVGSLVDSEINYRACPRGRVESVNGRLQCEGGDGGGYGGGYGGGGYGGGAATGLIVYENADYHGTRLEVSDSVLDLAGTGMDDRISSVRVLRGSWLLCSGHDFNGQCWTVEADNPNLREIGANEKITSIRRLPGRGR